MICEVWILTVFEPNYDDGVKCQKDISILLKMWQIWFQVGFSVMVV